MACTLLERCGHHVWRVIAMCMNVFFSWGTVKSFMPACVAESGLLHESSCAFGVVGVVLTFSLWTT